MNLCISETKKGFRALTKKDDLASAIAGLYNLKGVGPAIASGRINIKKIIISFNIDKY